MEYLLPRLIAAIHISGLSGGDQTINRDFK